MKMPVKLDRGERGAGASGPGEAAGERERESLRRGAGAAYAALAWALVVCVAVQVLLAGMAVFVDPLNWVRHVAFVHVFELIPVLMLILAVVARASRGQGLYLGPVLLWFLISLQYAFADAGKTVVAALHPVNALVIFWYAVHVATRVRPVRLALRKVKDADAAQA